MLCQHIMSQCWRVKEIKLRNSLLYLWVTRIPLTLLKSAVPHSSFSWLSIQHCDSPSGFFCMSIRKSLATFLVWKGGWVAHLFVCFHCPLGSSELLLDLNFHTELTYRELLPRFSGPLLFSRSLLLHGRHSSLFFEHSQTQLSQLCLLSGFRGSTSTWTFMDETSP